MSFPLVCGLPRKAELPTCAYFLGSVWWVRADIIPEAEREGMIALMGAVHLEVGRNIPFSNGCRQ